MLKHNFIDHVRICCRAGRGGDGVVHFRREKYVPKGGPDGGDGGRGGHIILRGNSQYWTLLHLKYRKYIVANNGEKGEGQNKSGKQGEDLYLDVPLGTVAKEIESGEKIGEILEDGQTMLVARGGRRGRGNQHFKSSTNQAPERAENGEDGETRWLILELKLLADVGFVGYPNAGKSTLLSVLSAAKPEIADYPFTTVNPNLGVVFNENETSFVVADLPGLIEGAHEGKGKGIRFLRHIERNPLLLFLISAESLSIKDEYNALITELSNYNPDLPDKRRVLAITKADLLDEELEEQLRQELPKDIQSIFISSATGYGIDELKKLIWKNLEELKKVENKEAQ